MPPLIADSRLFLGEDLLAWLVLAVGGALAVGNALALVRPPAKAREGELPRAPVGRSLVMLIVGLLASIWALASLLAS
ncbi:MAG: hypothetical protein ACRD12_02495 [Acidimicrobiales bacterium]